MEYTQLNCEITDPEMEHLLTSISDRYGYDFRNYAKSSFKRRLSAYFRKRGNSPFVEIVKELVSNKVQFIDFLNEITISTTELFRDPEFFSAFRNNVVPCLRALPTFKIWHAGCSTGEEVFSMAILLHECGLLERSLIYGTDINAYAIEKAKSGIVTEKILERDKKNYLLSGGKENLAQYWNRVDGRSVLDQRFLKRMVFGEHNLATDAAFNDLDVICCKNVLIYFNVNLQNRALELFESCLNDMGFLCIGSKESLTGTSVRGCFEVLHNRSKIYQKIIPKEPLPHGAT